MYFRLRKKLELQAIALLVYLALSFGLSFALEFEPRLRMSLESTLAGICYGLLVLGALLAAHLALSRVSRLRHRLALNETRAEIQKLSPTHLFGYGLLAGAGEELFFRVFVFGYLAAYMLWFGLLVNYMLGFALNYRNDRLLPWAFLGGPEHTLYALIYWETGSFFTIFLARFIADIALMFLLQRFGRTFGLELVWKNLTHRLATARGS